ncbi:MAG: capsule biosynthesis protein [Roseiarcus sp.]|jgi:capsular polysaccharide transport system permease protein
MDVKSEATTDERRAELATAEPKVVSPVPAGGALALVRRIVGRRPPPPPTIIEGAKGTIAVAAPRTRPPVYLISFLLLVVAPAFAAAVYFAFLASDQFVAETRFAVRSAQIETLGDKLNSALSSITVSIGTPVMAGQDAYIIATYIRSRAIIDDLSKTLDLREIFRRPEADFWARLKDGASVEELLAYWQGMVSVYVDAPSGVLTVNVRAFRREDALALSQAVIAASEALANAVSARARDDAMKRAESEVRRSEAQVVAALGDLRAFRDKEGMIDPVSAATSTGTLLTAALGEKIKLQNNLFVAVRAMSEDAPTVQALKTRLEGLDRQIDDLKSKLTGAATDGGPSVAGVLSRFEQLELQREFAEKLYEMAQDGLERARQKAEAQAIYVTVFVPPALPQEAKFPQRLALSLLIPIALAIVWGIFALIGAAVEDHRY